MNNMLPARSFQLAAGITLAPLLTFLLSACVIEKSKTGSGLRGVPVQATKPTSSPTAATKPGSSDPAIELPSGPIATPVTGATLVSRVVVSVVPLGAVMYDGQVLPLASPSGKFLAVEEGELPSSSILLAQDDAIAPVGTRIAIHRVDAKEIVRTEPGDALPPGLVLGRGADDQGFIVEQTLTGGARRIGKVAWIGGSLKWLTTESPDTICAHAVIVDSDHILFTRRRIGDPKAELVLRRNDGTEVVRRDAGGSYVFPLVTGDRAVVYSMIQTLRGLDIEAISLIPETTGPGLRLGSAVSRREIAVTDDPALAYQLIVPVQCRPLPPRTNGGVEPLFDRRLVLLHPRLNCMSVYDARSLAFLPLVPKSIAAVSWAESGEKTGMRSGFFCATPQDLVFTPAPIEGKPTTDRERRSDARVLSGAFVPRATLDADRPLILFAPDPADPARLRVFGVAVGNPVTSPQGR